MKLLGKDLPKDLWERLEQRLAVRGLSPAPPERRPDASGVEPRVDPLRFNLSALEENVDPTRALPLHTHRAGPGRVVVVAKWLFRKSCQVFINEALGRQRVFNGLVFDAYAQLSAEVVRLRRDLDTLRPRAEPAPVPAPPEPPPPEPPAPKRPAKRRTAASKATSKPVRPPAKKPGRRT